MRHAESLVEIAGEVGLFGQQNRRRDTGETLAVANQMSLIVIAAIDGGVNPIPGIPAEHSKYIVKAFDAAE